MSGTVLAGKHYKDKRNMSCYSNSIDLVAADNLMLQ
jgi:hypothetical protein